MTESRAGLDAAVISELARPSSVPPSPRESIAIIGIGCRLPGGIVDPRSYWRFLEAGQDAIGPTPADRWEEASFYDPRSGVPGKTNSRWGGYLDSLTRFDPAFFGISPREASSMDPQQRLLLEASWRALEDAGQPWERVAGQEVGVFIGISSIDYAVGSISFHDRGFVHPYSNTGGSASIAANRLSYCLDLRGPSLAVDTACSSSLVALHLACEALRSRECSAALVGGVNALLLPDFYIAFSQLGVLSPDGRCKTFDARANGYVRSEGVGVVLLKPLLQAMRDGDRIYAVIRGSAVNQDGKTPGLTVPSQAAQAALVRAACRQAGVEPWELSYVEAHGTGTPVGDPIEANALGEVLRQGRAADQPCWIGSVKTNLGHLEAGAGIASLIKVALALYHRRIPKHLHFQHPHPAIDFQRLGLRLPLETTDWSPTSRLRLAGINGFGYGGTNAHVILAELEASPATHRARRSSPTAADNQRSTPCCLFPLSARSPAALADHLQSHLQWLQEQPASSPLDEYARHWIHRRSHFAHRLAVVAQNREELIDRWQALSSNLTSHRPSFAAKAGQAPTAIVFAFCGQGPQWYAMGRALMEIEPIFRLALERCDAEFRRWGSWSLIEELKRDQASTRMQQTAITQPSLFAIQVALVELWKSWGIHPQAVIGHSVGEIAAAYTAGALSWEAACRVAYHRGRTMDLATSRGGMLAVGASAAELETWLSALDGKIVIAAINGPQSLTLSGDEAAIADLAQGLSAAGYFCRQLAVEYAFHSPHMEPVQSELRASLDGLSPAKARLPMVSTVTGQWLHGDELDADYWWHNVRQPVEFERGMQQLCEEFGDFCVIEIGPHPVLNYAIQECLASLKRQHPVLASLRREVDDQRAMLESLAQLYQWGFEIDWSGVADRPTSWFDLPSYPFQHQHFWSEPRQTRLARQPDRRHPLLGVSTHGSRFAWQGRIDLRDHTYLADHCVRGVCVYPAAAIIESSLAAARQLADNQPSAGETSPSSPILLERLQLMQPCVFSGEQPQWIEVQHDPGRQQLVFACRHGDQDSWVALAKVTVSQQRDFVREELGDWTQSWQRCHTEFEATFLYDYCRSLGLQYGSAFQGLKRGRRRDGEAVAEVCLAEAEQAASDAYFVHPALLDACFHSMIAADDDFGVYGMRLKLPAEIRAIYYHRPALSKLIVHTRIVEKTSARLVADLDLYHPSGELCLSLRGFESRAVAGGKQPEAAVDLMYGYQWIPQPLPPLVDADAGRVVRAAARNLIFADQQGVASKVAAILEAGGEQVQCVVHPSNTILEKDGLVDRPQLTAEAMVQVIEGFLDVAKFNQGSVEPIAERAAAAPPPLRLLYFWGLDVPSVNKLSTAQLAESQSLTTLIPLYLVQAWERLAAGLNADLYLITRHAQSLDNLDAGKPPVVADLRRHFEVAQAPLVGFGRVIANEYPRLRTRLIDVVGEWSASMAEFLVREFQHSSDEDEVLLSAGDRWVRRFQPLAGSSLARPAQSGLAYELRAGAIPNIDDLHYTTQPPTLLKENEVEIEVLAAGMNFSDVMKALDLYPGLTEDHPKLGAECAGRISRIGSGVRGWQVGDEVMAVAPGAMASHVVCSAELIASKPRKLSFAEAAAIPIAFLTADYALNDCGRLQAGERLLIHAATGGVGQAAIQIARLVNAELFATAGSEEKRRHLAQQGIRSVMNSRSLAFADELREITGGEGIDMVLNSLPGEAIAKGLSTLRVGGRFLEIGKRDIYADAPLGLFPMRNNLALFAIDLDQLLKQRPKFLGDRLRQIAQRLEHGELQPLPTRAFAAEETQAAFRWMQQAKHIGKLTIDYAHQPSAIRGGRDSRPSLKAEATYWLIGGLGGFGLELAGWLISCGARFLVLSNRRAQIPAEAQAMIARWRAQGVTVSIRPLDVTDPSQVLQAWEAIEQQGPPIRGIFHTAMVLEDRLLIDLDRPTLSRVLDPKMLGGWNLHLASQQRQLDHFVLFSSLSSIFGHAGQANYAAANAMLDVLAHHREALGLPALTINWGHIGGAGYLAQRQELSERLERQGVLRFQLEEAFECLGLAMQWRTCQASVLRMDWSRWQGLGTTRIAPKFAHLIERPAADVEAAASSKLSNEALAELDGPQRKAWILESLVAKTAKLLGASAAEVDVEQALLEMGLDSLMAVELRNWIENTLKQSLPVAQVLRSRSLRKLAEQLSGGFDGNLQLASSRTASVAMEPVLPEVYPMSLGQQGLWYAYQRDPQATAYNVFLPIRVRSSLNLPALQQSLVDLTQRHRALRTTFFDDEGGPSQRSHARLDPEFVVEEWTDVPLAEIQQRLVAEAGRPFDLQRGPLLRMVVYRLAEDDWVLMAIAHHIVVDFWSLVLIIEEMRQRYAALAADRPVNLPSLSGDYAMFVQGQQAHVAGTQAEQHRHYWQRRLAKTAAITELPTDFSRPPIFTGRAAVVPLPLTPQLSHGLLSLAANQRVTPFTLLMAALQVLVSKYTQQNNFIIGTPFAARGQQAFEKTVGFFVNMLPIAADLEGDPSFDQLLQGVARTLEEAMAHEDYPLAAIVRDLGPARDPSRSPLFQVTCTFEKSQLRPSRGLAGLLFPQQPQPISFAGLQQETFYVPQTTCHHDLEFVLEHGDDSLGGMLIYCRDLFEEASARALAAAFKTILEEVVEQPTRRLSQLLRNTRKLPSCPRPLATVIPAWTGAVKRFSDRPALRAGDRRITYSELDCACRELAQQLTSRGVQPQTMVPILAERGATAWLAIWACLLHGRIPVPIEAAMPTVAIDSVIDETQAALVLTDSQARYQSLSTRLPVPVLAVQHATDRLDPLREPPVAPKVHPEDLAYVIYTSGSTGRPKGVMIEHGALFNTLRWRQETLPVDEHDRILLLLSHQFDASFGIVFAAWMVGAEVVVADEPTARNVDLLLERLIADDITILPCLPSWLSWIVAHPRFKDCRGLRQVWCGGEPLPPSLAQQILESTTIRLWNFYGPTEATIECVAGEVRDAVNHRPIPIGRPIHQTSLLVLDQHRQLQPQGVVGELAIIGPGVARGYLRQPELTAERFIPWKDASGQLHRAYLTGDFGRERSDGLFEFLGRRDMQIKFRGFRIELSEIEQALLVHPGVGQAVAWVEAAATAQARLRAAVEPAGNPADEALNGERLRRFLSEKLPAFKVPAWIEIVEHFPRNASGKVDRQRLEKRGDTVPRQSSQDAATGNPLEDYLAELWQECLGIPELPRDRTFFDLGGTSLQAARMTALLSQRLGVRVPTSLVFDLADIRQMASRLIELYPRPLEERFGRPMMPADGSWVDRPLATSGLEETNPSLHPLLVPLQPLGQQPPLFLVHPPGGFVLCYRELSQQLTAGRPCYAIRARGLYAEEGLPESVEAMATEYVTAIRARQPRGPYAIGGWSLGGVIAFEVAQQLLRAGERVDSLIMLDSAIPESNLAEGASDGLRAGAEYGIPMTLEELSRLDDAQQLPFLWQHARQLGLIAAEADEELAQQVIQDLKRLFAQHLELCSRYRLQSYPGRIVLIRPLDLPIAIAGPEDRGWSRYAAHVDTYRTPGQHHSMVQSPHVQSLAAIVDSCLAQPHPISPPSKQSTSGMWQNTSMPATSPPQP